MSQVTVFFDGACPLCVKEISLLKRLDKRERIAFVDVSPPDAAEFCPIDRQKLLARFHVERPDGRLIDGAEAFTEAYAQIPGLSWVRVIGRFAPIRAALNGLYAVFLKVRPSLQRLVRKRASNQ